MRAFASNSPGQLAIAAAAHGAAGSHGDRQAADWSALADRITAELTDCVHRTGRWQRAPGYDRVDASLLLPGLHDGPAAADPRTAATYRAPSPTS